MLGTYTQQKAPNKDAGIRGGGTYRRVQEFPVAVVLFLDLGIDLGLHRGVLAVDFDQFEHPFPQLRGVEAVDGHALHLWRTTDHEGGIVIEGG